MENQSTIQELKTGKLLIAQPFMQDDFFKKSVLLIADYHETGTVGFMLNRLLRVNVKQLISDFPDFSAPVYMGGPVEKNTVHYLHTAGPMIEGSKEVMSGIYWGGDFNQLKFFVSNQVISPHDIRFYVGYSGWTPGQLEDELKETNSWLIADAHPNYIFYRENVDVWKQALSHKSENLSVLTTMKEELNFN